MRKFLSLSLILICIMTMFTVNANAVGFEFNFERDDEKVQLTTDTLLMISLDTGDVIFDKNGSEKRYPASITKIMTYCVVVDKIKDFNTKVPIKEELIDQLAGTDSSLAGLEYHIGGEMTVKDLLYCLMVSSGNDAALALADYVGGSEAEFVKMMNDKAKELGCNDTHFENSHGLHNDNHYTTAYDIVKITKHALSLPMFEEITGTTEYYCEGDTYPIVTTNFMIDENRGGLYYYRYAKGIKTGSTDAAGKCLVSTAVYNGYTYLIVALKAPSDAGYNYAMIDSANLYRWAFLGFELYPVATSATPICEQKIDLAWKKSGVVLTSEVNYSTILPNGVQDSDITIEPHIAEIVDAPIQKGQVLGTADVYYKDKFIKTINLVSSETVERSWVMVVLRELESLVTNVKFLIGASVVIFLFMVFIIVMTSYKKKKNRQRYLENRRRMAATGDTKETVNTKEKTKV